jgi:hypothetical protein
MKITERRNIDGDGYGSMDISVKTSDDSGSVDFCAYVDSPEDNTFHRDLNSALSIHRLLTLAYEAGQRGETYEYEFINETEAV